jgi:predicted acetyltransferase
MTTRTSPLPIRQIQPEDWPTLLAMDALAFGGSPHDDAADIEKELFPWDRSLGSYDGDQLVGAAAAFRLRMAVPGGALRPMAGVTWVSVLPSYRRRGLTRAHMHKQLQDLYEAGDEAVAALWASEPGIYGRFGYGLASSSIGVEVPRPTRLVGTPADPSLRLRLMPAPDSADTVAPLYDELVAAPTVRPGMLTRESKLWWQRVLADRERDHSSTSVLTCAVVERGSIVRGYAVYRMRSRWDTFRANGTVEVREIHAAEPAALAMLYEFLLDVDLTAETALWNLPLDDPLLYWMADRRAADPRLRDTLYVRLLDVGRALGERCYAADVDLVFDVQDSVCPWNVGRWRLQGGRDGAACARTQRGADLTLDVRELGAAYLGAPAFGPALLAGYAEELTPDAAARAAVAFGHELAPFCPYIF